MASNNQTGERLARIETLIEAANAASEASRLQTHADIAEIKADVKALRKEFEADKAELKSLKDKGTGLLIGVGLVGGSVGAAIVKAWNAFVGG